MIKEIKTLGDFINFLGHETTPSGLFVEHQNFVSLRNPDGGFTNGSYNRAWKMTSPYCGAVNCTMPIIVFNGSRIRRLTPCECLRLMGLREEDVERLQSCGLTPGQLRRLAGNSIVADGVLTGIFTKMFRDHTPPSGEQLRLF